MSAHPLLLLLTMSVINTQALVQLITAHLNDLFAYFHFFFHLLIHTQKKSRPSKGRDYFPRYHPNSPARWGTLYYNGVTV